MRHVPIETPKPGGRPLSLSAAWLGRVARILNALLGIEIKRGEYDKAFWADGNLILQLKRIEAFGGSGTGAITVQEEDGTPSDPAVTKIRVPNGSLTQNSSGDVSIALGSLNFKEVDTSPSVGNVTTVVVPNGSLTNDGGGQVTLTFGAGSSLQRYRVKSVQGDYVTCRTWDGSTEGGTDVHIAKPFKLRHSITSATVDGASMSYSYGSVFGNLDGKRIASRSSPSASEDQYVTPRWLVNDEIWAETAGSTGVSVSGTPLTLIDVNCDGRAWAAE